jgi:hypothetical protein
MSQKLTEPTKVIRRGFLNYLKERYVVDESGNFPRAISGSGRPQNLTSLVYEFPEWAKGHPERQVPREEYLPLIASLEPYIRGRLARVCGISFKPVAGRSFVDSKGDTLLNTYMSYAPVRPANYSECKIILDDYAARLFHQNRSDHKHVLQFCGETVQNPSRRSQHGIIMRGAPGTGKSSLPNLLKVALGGRYVWSENEYTPAFKQFSEVLPNNLVVSFDDATASKNTYEDLKLATTRDTANVEIKGVQAIVEREVYARIFVISNSRRPFIMPADDRRFYVTEYLDHRIDQAESEAYYASFTAFWKNPDNAAAIYWWFRDIDLDGFKPHACPRTEARNQLIAMSTSNADTAIAEFIGGSEICYIDAKGVTQTEAPPVRTVFLEKQILGHLQERGVKDMPPDMLNLKLRNKGYVPARRIVGTCNNGKQIEVWQKDATRSPRLTPEQVDELTLAYEPF